VALLEAALPSSCEFSQPAGVVAAGVESQYSVAFFNLTAAEAVLNASFEGFVTQPSSCRALPGVHLCEFNHTFGTTGSKVAVARAGGRVSCALTVNATAPGVAVPWCELEANPVLFQNGSLVALLARYGGLSSLPDSVQGVWGGEAFSLAGCSDWNCIGVVQLNAGVWKSAPAIARVGSAECAVQLEGFPASPPAGCEGGVQPGECLAVKPFYCPAAGGVPVEDALACGCPVGFKVEGAVCVPGVATHAACSGGQCVAVLGAGVDSCGVNADCVHAACVSGQCVSADGAGIDLCSGNSDCVAKHSKCAGGQCVLVEGAGDSSCVGNVDCELVFHNACLNEQCVPVAGGGADACSGDGNCVAKHSEC
ncbi:MAG: hypothetical protein AABW54_04370, partial [Candidatus Micrarchaeota archaeon]